jgi:hypothetical protein
MKEGTHMLFSRIFAACALLPLVAHSSRAQTLVHTLVGGAPGDRFGTAIAALGDLDGDGVDEFVVGAPGDDTAGLDAGLVRLFSGASGAALHTFLGSTAGDFFGTSLAAVGDVDGDGFGDFVVGAPQVDYVLGEWGGYTYPAFGSGYVKVFSGQTYGVIHHLSGTAANEGYGLSVAGGTDVDGDGVPDFMVGGPGDTLAGASLGHIWARSGATGGNIWREEVIGLGYAVALVGDIDGDGLDEFAGSQFNHNHAELNGRVRLFSSLDGTELWNKSGGIGDEFGTSLARVGDVNGDGVPDVAVGATENASFVAFGRGRVSWRDGTDGSSLGTLQGASTFRGLGFSVCPLGDLDGDGRTDVAISAPGVFGNSGLPVAIHSSPAGTLLASIPLPAGGDRFGYSLARSHHGSVAALIVGDTQTNLASVGQVTVHTLDLAPFAYCTAKTNSQGCQASISSTGSPSASHGPFTVDATNVINNKNGLLFYGFVPAASPFAGGVKCVGNPVRRTAVQSSGGNPPPDDCSGAFSFDFAARIQSGIDPSLIAGETVYCQYWYRDPRDPQFTSLSNGLWFFVAP